MFKFLKGMKKNRKGYTLTELIVVVAILGVLAAVATPLISKQLSSAKDNTDKANCTTLLNSVKTRLADGTFVIPPAGATNEGLICDASGTKLTSTTLSDELKKDFPSGFPKVQQYKTGIFELKTDGTEVKAYNGSAAESTSYLLIGP